MLLDRSLPDHFLVEVVSIVCHILNRCLIRLILNKTPYELWIGKKPNISYFHPFGCKFFIHNNGKNNLGCRRSQEVKAKSLPLKQLKILHISILKALLKSRLSQRQSWLLKLTKVPREWRNNTSYPENFILGELNNKIHKRFSLRKQASIASIAKM